MYRALKKENRRRIWLKQWNIYFKEKHDQKYAEMLEKFQYK